MSVDSKLFVTCGKDKMFEAGNAVIVALTIVMIKTLSNYIKDY